MQAASWLTWLSLLGSRIFTWRQGVLVGTDGFGNRYYRGKNAVKGQREKRWVMYAGEPEASLVPPEWHIWLHHQAASPLSADSVFHKQWQAEHQPNLTGSAMAYHPPGHVLSGQQRAKATGDYQAWTPPSS